MRGSGIGVGVFGLFIFFFFFAPWTAVTCSGHVLMEQAGVEVASGEIQTSSDFDEMADDGDSSMETDELEGAPYLWLVLLMVPIVGIGAVLMIMRKKAGALMGIVGGAVVVVVCFASIGIGFPIEDEIERAMQEQEDEDPEIKMELETERRGGFYLTMFSGAGAGGLALLGLLLGGKKEE